MQLLAEVHSAEQWTLGNWLGGLLLLLVICGLIVFSIYVTLRR